MLVQSNYWETEKAFWEKERLRAKKDLATQGYTVLRNLVPKAHLEALANYNKKLWETMGGLKINEQLGMQKCNYNDEPVARYLNHQLTEFMARFMGEPVLHPGLALTIWIMSGEGFPMHMDSVPPFDLTLDLVLDHFGPSPRPVTFVRPASRLFPSVKEETLCLDKGEAVLFRGSEMLHYGGDMPRGCYHNVVLFTWSYVRD